MLNREDRIQKLEALLKQVQENRGRVGQLRAVKVSPQRPAFPISVPDPPSIPAANALPEITPVAPAISTEMHEDYEIELSPFSGDFDKAMAVEAAPEQPPQEAPQEIAVPLVESESESAPAPLLVCNTAAAAEASFFDKPEEPLPRTSTAPPPSTPSIEAPTIVTDIERFAVEPQASSKIAVFVASEPRDQSLLTVLQKAWSLGKPRT